MSTGVSVVLRAFAFAVACTILTTAPAAGQPASQEIVEQLRQLRLEVEALRQELAALRDSQSQDQALTNAKLQEHEQAKVESGSKYPVRLSGLILFNAVSTRGNVDSIDQPLAAQPLSDASSAGSFGASIRQSFLAVEVFGPKIGGAKTAGDLSFDFFGGFPETADGLSALRPRLRTAGMKLDWDKVSVFAGQEAPFFSPLSPTSLFSTAYPAFSSSGNLWTWTPEVYVAGRHSFANGSLFTLSGGILDPFTGQIPTSEYDRLPTAGERTSTPALALHAGYRSADTTRPIVIGGGAYYSQQDWGFDRSVGAWAMTADWDVPLGRVVSVSGEFYNGRAIAGLGGGLTSSVFFDGDEAIPITSVVPIDSKGGWLQLKVAPSARLEFNGAFGGDWPAAIESARLRRNATGLVNAIYQLRSNVTFSIEYRRLATTIFGERATTANHFSLNTGLGF